MKLTQQHHFKSENKKIINSTIIIKLITFLNFPFYYLIFDFQKDDVEFSLSVASFNCAVDVDPPCPLIPYSLSLSLSPHSAISFPTLHPTFVSLSPTAGLVPSLSPLDLPHPPVSAVNGDSTAGDRAPIHLPGPGFHDGGHSHLHHFHRRPPVPPRTPHSVHSLSLNRFSLSPLLRTFHDRVLVSWLMSLMCHDCFPSMYSFCQFWLLSQRCY